MTSSSQADCCDRATELLDKVPPCTGSADETEPGIGICGWLLTMISWGIVMVTLPFSLFVCFKVVQEYERAVIFRLGRLLHGGSRGPGIFFVLPCIESYQKVDLRTITLGVPPQEVRVIRPFPKALSFFYLYCS
jgi:erythrocyte band 7 integral membrane protein